MQTFFERLNDTGKKVAGFVFACSILWVVLILNLVFNFLENTQERKIQEQQTTWVKPQPITSQEEKQKVKSFWSLTLKFEEGESDE